MVGCVTVWCIPVAGKIVWRQEDTQADSVPLTNVSQWGQLNFFPMLIPGHRKADCVLVTNIPHWRQLSLFPMLIHGHRKA
jgi:hypothetical protein